jgi:hypothetical protein
MKMVHDKLTLEDNFTLEKVINYIENTADDDGDTWEDLLPSFQLVIVKWLVVELYHTQKLVKEQDEILERYL